MSACYHCGKEILHFGRQDQCDGCGRDVRVCRNCLHYDRSYNNECKEEQASRQVEKEKGNFCEWFQARAGGTGEKSGATKTDLKSAAESLFKKK